MEKKFQRNREIFLLSTCGYRYASIARRFNLSATRIKQIVDKEYYGEQKKIARREKDGK